jgi:hypothetical protein
MTASELIPDTWAEIESVASIAALAVGAVWTWLLFVRGRQRWPQARCTHRFSSSVLPTGERLLRAKVGIENVGNRLLVVQRIVGRVQRIAPLTDLAKTQLNAYREDKGQAVAQRPQVDKKS